jgi:Flp pilus assembly pilin Flp
MSRTDDLNMGPATLSLGRKGDSHRLGFSVWSPNERSHDIDDHQALTEMLDQGMLMAHEREQKVEEQRSVEGFWSGLRSRVSPSYEERKHMEKLQNLKDEAGQTMAEYSVVLAVITIAVVVTLGTLSSKISETLQNVITSL